MKKSKPSINRLRRVLAQDGAVIVPHPKIEMASVGAAPVKMPRVRDRGDEPLKVRFTSTILPPYPLPGKGVSFDALLADKAFDADWLLQDLDARGSSAVIPPKANRKIQRDYDTEVCKWRHLVENYFARIKEFRAIATRYDKTDCSYAACWNLAATLISSR